MKQPWYNVETGAAMQEAKNMAGMKEVLTIQVGDNESAKYWLSVLNELKNRGVKDILILCADGLIGLKEAISAVFPNTEYQRCIVHQQHFTTFTPPRKLMKLVYTRPELSPLDFLRFGP